MDDTSRMKSLLSALTKDLGNEELTLTVLQSLIASEIVIRRTKAGLSQAQLAEQLGVSQSTLSKWESGECNFRLSTLVSIAGKLGIEMQSPFVLTPPVYYPSRSSNVVRIVPSSQYYSGASYYDREFQSSGLYEADYEEM